MRSLTKIQQRIGMLMALAILNASAALYAAPAVACGAFGAKFNLEPNTPAVPQQLEAVDFIPNRVGPNEDLVVTGAYDFRGAGLGSLPRGCHLGRECEQASYVHRSTTPDCGPQFEGGLPRIVSGSSVYLGNGGVSVAADPRRDAFFVADLRFESTTDVSAIGLFRASSTTLLNTSLCPNGTHTAAQEKSCWEQTPAVVLDPNPPGVVEATLDFPAVVVDERPTKAGVGAGDVYVAFGDFNETTGGIILIACTNGTLSCSTPLVISQGSPEYGSVDAHVQVRPDGNITVTYVDQNSPPSNTIHFVMCTPGGAPNAPVCSAPVIVANENQALGPTLYGGSLSGLDMHVFTAARHADRLEPDGKTVTTFVVWDRCAVLFQPPSTGYYATCLKCAGSYEFVHGWRHNLVGAGAGKLRSRPSIFSMDLHRHFDRYGKYRLLQYLAGLISQAYGCLSQPNRRGQYGAGPDSRCHHHACAMGCRSDAESACDWIRLPFRDEIARYGNRGPEPCVCILHLNGGSPGCL